MDRLTKLIIPNTDNKSEDVLKYNFDKFINDHSN